MRRPLRYSLAAGTLALTGLAPVFGHNAVAQTPATVYVSPTGSDTSGTGASAAPFATVGHAVSTTAAGSTVVLEPGTYKEQVTITQLVTLQSDSSQPNAAATTIIDATGLPHGVVIQGAATAGTTINGLTIENAQQEGLIATSTTNLTIENNVVTGNDTSTPPPNQVTQDTPDIEALHIIGVTNSSIVNNTVENNHDGGIYLTDETGPTTGNTISGNKSLNNLVDCGITLANHNPAAAVSNNIIKGNTSSGNGSIGIGIFSPVPNGQAKDNQVLNNTVENNASAGIAMHSHAPGADLSGTVIDGNTVSGNGPDLQALTTGIAIGGDVSPIANTSITNNTISDEQVGIALLNATPITIQGNNIAASVSTPVLQVTPAPPPGSNGVQAVPHVSTAPSGVNASFTVTFTSAAAGQGYVYFGSSCNGLLGVATQDQGAGTTSHTILVSNNELGQENMPVLPGETYYYEVVTVSASGTTTDNNGGACYSITMPAAPPAALR